MFTGNMVTEAIPARVFSLYKIVTSKKEIARNEVQSLMEPSEIYEGSSYFSSIIKAAIELKIVDTKRKHKERRTNVKNKSSKTKYILQVRVSKEKICEMSREFKESLKLLIKDANNSSKIIGRLNTKILGWQNYCKLSTYPSKDLNEVYMRNYTKMNVLKRYYGILKCMNMHIN